MVNDGFVDFGLKSCYIISSEQLSHCEIQVLDMQKCILTSGKEIMATDNTIDNWIYYMSKAP